MLLSEYDSSETIDAPLYTNKRAFTRRRRASLADMMEICCYAGCEISDLAGYCSPFDMWNL